MPIVTHKDNGSEFEVNEKVGQTGWPSMVLEINAQLGVSGAADRSSHGSGLHSRVWWPSFCFCLRQKNSALTLTQKEPSQYMSATRASYIFNNLYALLMKNMLRLRFKFKVQSFKSIDESIVQFCEMCLLWRQPFWNGRHSFSLDQHRQPWPLDLPASSPARSWMLQQPHAAPPPHICASCTSQNSKGKAIPLPSNEWS